MKKIIIRTMMAAGAAELAACGTKKAAIQEDKPKVDATSGGHQTGHKARPTQGRCRATGRVAEDGLPAPGGCQCLQQQIRIVENQPEHTVGLEEHHRAGHHPHEERRRDSHSCADTFCWAARWDA